jgi:hypothetical protein
LYSSTSNNSPGSPLWQGVINNPRAGAWNMVTVNSYSLSAAQTYWIVILSPKGNGNLRFRKATTGGATSVQRNLSVLPATWGGKPYDSSVLSAYLDQSG